jgi:hypothetical protein
MNDQLHRVQHPSQLSTLAGWRAISWRAPQRVVLEAEGAFADRARLWEKQLDNLRSVCGCEQGAAGLIVGVVGFTLYLLLRAGGWGRPGHREFWIGLGVMVATSSVGKFAGLLWTHVKGKQVIREIQTDWKPALPQLRYSGAIGRRQTDASVGPIRCGGPSPLHSQQRFG